MLREKAPLISLPVQQQQNLMTTAQSFTEFYISWPESNQTADTVFLSHK